LQRLRRGSTPHAEPAEKRLGSNYLYNGWRLQSIHDSAQLRHGLRGEGVNARHAPKRMPGRAMNPYFATQVCDPGATRKAQGLHRKEAQTLPVSPLIDDFIFPVGLRGEGAVFLLKHKQG
jgi:hypothetical protein